MSHSNPVSEADSPESKLPVVADPKKNPSYPQRTHLLEKPRWLSILAGVESRLAVPRQKISVLGGDPMKPGLEKLYAQMLGARDQVSDAVKRLPQETGDLYEEDKHRVEAAIAALDRLFQKWESQTTAR